ncbi:MAG: hypothetical protein AB4042_19120 [Leptolyngbyaceae cyanobacterium]
MATKTASKKSAAKKSASKKSVQSQAQQPAVSAASASPVDGDRMVRLLLTLLEVEGDAVLKGKVTKKLPRSGKNKERSADYASVIQEVMDKQLLCEDGREWHLERSGIEALLLEYLLEYLNQPNCPGFISGAGKTKVLLKLLRDQAVAPTTAVNGNGNGNGKVELLEPITSYEEFKQVAMDMIRSLDKGYNMDNLVPIYRVRRELGERVGREGFNDWLLEMQSEDMVQLIGGQLTDAEPDKIADSIETSIGGLRFYIQIL